MLLCLSIGVVGISVFFSINSLKQHQEAQLNDFSTLLDRTFASFQSQINNLALNDFVVNSLVDFSTHDTYLPIFFRSLRLAGAENVSIIYTDFAGEVITGKNVYPLKEKETHFDWKKTVLEQSQPYFKFTEHGVFSAAPIFYANSAEAALAAYVPNLESMLSKEFVSEDLFVVVTKAGVLVYSNQPSVVASGSIFNAESFKDSFIAQTDFGNVNIYSLKPTSEVYRNILELAILVLLALFIVLFFTIYSIRLASALATRSLNQLHSSMDILTGRAQASVTSEMSDEEPIEFYHIRQEFIGLAESLFDTSMSRDKFLNIINSLDEFLLVVDFDGNIILCNESVERLMGQMQLTLPKGWVDLFPVDFISISAMSDDEKSLNKKYCFKLGGKTSVAEVSWNKKIYRNEAGELLGYIISGADITREKSLKAELFIQTKAIEEASSPVIISDASTEAVTYVNKAFTQLTGYLSSEFVGQNYHALQGADTSLDDIKAIRQAIDEQKPISVTMLNYKKDGSEFHNRLTLNPIFNDEGEMTHIVGMLFDVTERALTERYLKEAKDRAEESARLKSDFLASMSHEIRTPMNGVLGMLSLLTNTELNTEQLYRVEIAQSSARSLLTLINDILDFSKIEAGKLELEELDFDLTHMLGEFVESVSLQAQEKGLELILDTTQIKHTQVKGDSGRIRQVLTNIVSNAIKFTQQGEIIIKVAIERSLSHGLTLNCLIQDTGIGIPPNKLASLFDSFSQVDASTTRKYGGTGLGLAIVKKLCQLMSGDISVKSQDGNGSIFSFHLQLKEGKSTVRTLPCVNFGELDVLIVDDNQTNREVLQSQLDIWGANVTEAHGGPDALRICRDRVASGEQKIFDVALLDMQMPDMNGATLGEKILADPHFNSMKLIMMTSIDSQYDAAYFASIGFHAYFAKPATASDLFDAINIVIDDGEALRQADPLVTHGYLKNLTPAKTESSDLSALAKHNRILLVEDNQINQLVALGTLERESFLADVAGNGIEALHSLKIAVQADAYTLVLMDCQMPEMDGYEATQAIRRGEAGEHNINIPIIAMTANAMTGDREKCLAVGMNDYLSKPLVNDALFEILEKWLNDSR
jgi:PAS domain S-box-containing protein